MRDRYEQRSYQRLMALKALSIDTADLERETQQRVEALRSALEKEVRVAYPSSRQKRAPLGKAPQPTNHAETKENGASRKATVHTTFQTSTATGLVQLDREERRLTRNKQRTEEMRQIEKKRKPRAAKLKKKQEPRKRIKDSPKGTLEPKEKLPRAVKKEPGTPVASGGSQKRRGKRKKKILVTQKKSADQQIIWRVDRIEEMELRGNKIYYLIKWEGFPPEANSWEPAENILDPSLIHAFNRRKKKKKA